MAERVAVIVGAGQAAFTAIGALRKANPWLAIDLIGDELHTPHQRPPLSKKYLAGSVSLEQLGTATRRLLSATACR